MYVPHSPEDVKFMLKALGLSSEEDLFSHIDDSLLKPPDDLPPPKSEEEIRELFKKIASKNKSLISFCGAGSYDRIIPSVIPYILSRGEFLTAYTPYQPEASQGTLQAIFEYQSVICDLTGMDVANASVYDGASALAEAVLMAKRLKPKKTKVVISQAINPLYRRVLRTYLSPLEEPIEEVEVSKEGTTDLEKLWDLSKEAQVIAVQYPNFFGYVEPLKEISEIAKERESLLVVVADPVALAILKPPGELGADIVVGEGQQLGVPLNFGGPYVGFFATKQEYVRQMPGRISGLAQDIEGKTAYTLILQTREQHIRRERATSNICTNQNLLALANLLYITLLGAEGLREVAIQSISKAYYLKEKLLDLGFEEVFEGKHLWEFPLKKEGSFNLRERLKEKGILLGVPLDRFFPSMKDTLLIAVTEKRKREEMDRVAEVIGEGN